jgi:hypothetical protein
MFGKQFPSFRTGVPEAFLSEASWKKLCARSFVSEALWVMPSGITKRQ